MGKTELVKALAEFLFNDEQALVRIDMSEYMEKHSSAKLIGAPPGYVGYEEGGQLTEAVRRKPYSVVLFDEIEKAHHDVFNILLQILDEGRLTDSQGKTVDFKNTMIIMTSNIGSGLYNGGPYSRKEIESKMSDELKRHFRPEFINRVDEIIVFNPLTAAEIRSIIDIQLKNINRTLGNLADRHLALSFTDGLRDYLAEKGFDPVYGARPLSRIIQKAVMNPLAENILRGSVGTGTITAGIRDGSVFFSGESFSGGSDRTGAARHE